MDTTEQEIIEPLTQADVSTKKKRTKRRHSLEFKRRLVKESIDGTDSVSVIARRYDINANMLFLWRRLHEKGELGINSSDTTLLPVRLTPAEPATPTTLADSTQGRLDIILPSGAKISITGSVCDTTLQSVLKAMLP